MSVGLWLLLATGVACNAPQATVPPPRVNDALPKGGGGGDADRGLIRDLSQDEAAGGHTLRKHVGRTDDELRERLSRERNISAASTWTDRPTAERSIGAALAQNQARIQRWLDRSNSRSNLVLDYDGDSPLGRTMPRGAGQSEPCSHATIVLKRTGDRDYYVLTAYPECRA